MADSVQSAIKLTLSFVLGKSLLGETQELKPNSHDLISLPDGLNAGEADTLFLQDRTLNTTSEELDLSSLTDPFGDAISFANVILVFVKNLSTGATDTVTIGGAAANAFPLFVDSSDKMALEGEEFTCNYFKQEKAVGANNKLKIETDFNGQYRIAILGQSA